jgi:hypothetical protein
MDEETLPVADQTAMDKGDDRLRLWLSKEAMRQGELYLTAQAANLVAMEGRAISILGWTVAGTFVLGAAALDGRFRAAAGLAALFLFLATLSTVSALWPRLWGIVGYDPAVVLDVTFTSELEMQEHLAKDISHTIRLNEERLEQFASLLAASWIFVVLAPLSAFITTFLAASSGF